MANKENEYISFPLRLTQEVERLFDEMIHQPWGFSREIRGWNPSMDLLETIEAFILEADLPGVKAENVKVEVKDGELVLQGWRSFEKSHSNGRYHTMERCFGHFVRRMKLPQSVVENDIQVEFRDGVLRAILPKLKTKERTIIEAGVSRDSKGFSPVK
jgi:HSP20 family protein